MHNGAQPMSEEGNGQPVTRRSFLQAVGAMGGGPILYRTMSAMGFLGPASLSAACGPDMAKNSGDGVRVLVLGAGIAGMTAAYELSQAGYGCTLLEATARAGGRNRTARAGDELDEVDSRQTCNFDSDDHMYFNLGPARIPYHHRHLLGYCRDFGVALEVFSNDNRAALFHGIGPGTSVTGRQLYTDTRGWIAELLAKAVNKGALDQELTSGDKQTFLDMLTEFGDLNADAGYAYQGSSRGGFGGDVNPGLGNPSDLPLAATMTLQEILGGYIFHGYQASFPHSLNQNPTMFQPVGGMDKIAEAFEARVEHLIQYESVIRSIENQSDCVQVVYEQNGDTFAEKADFVICTIPATVLRDINNNFSAAVRAEIADMQYNDAVKIGFQAERRFWEEDLGIYGGISWTDQDITQMWYPATGYHRQKGVFVAAYTWNNTWDPEGTQPATNPYFANRTPAERLVEAKRQVERIHAGAAAELEHGISRAWGKVPFQVGAWADDTFQYQAHGELSQPDGRVYFAGEHVSYLPGWQEGAVLSAHASVQAIADLVAQSS